jgi:hypothetical protein
MNYNEKLNAAVLKKGRIDSIFFASSFSSSNHNVVKHGIKLGQLKNLNTYTTVGSLKYSLYRKKEKLIVSSFSSSNRIMVNMALSQDN